MDSLEKIWDSIDENKIDTNTIDKYIEKKSDSQTLKFKNTIKLELLFSLIIALVAIFYHETLNTTLIGILILILFFSLSIGIYALIKLKNIRLITSVKEFITKTISFLKLYIILFLIGNQLVILTVFFLLKKINILNFDTTNLVDSEENLSILLVFFIIEITLIIYAYFFYYKRILNFKNILSEI